MGKTIILSVSCSDVNYTQEEHVILDTWGHDIVNGLCENVMLIFVRSGKEPVPVYDEDSSVLYVSAGDAVHDTYNKVLKAIKYVDDNFEYDYILKTNTSTYINVKLLKQFISGLPRQDNNIYGPRYIINGSSGGKLYFRGSFLLFPRAVVADILKTCGSKVKNVDDGEIFKRLHSYYEKNGVDLYERMKQVPQGYYLENKSVVPYLHEYAKDKLSYRLKPTYAIRRGEEGRFLIRDKMRSLHAYIVSDDKEFVVPDLNAENVVETLNGIVKLKDGIKKSKNSKRGSFALRNW